MNRVENLGPGLHLALCARLGVVRPTAVRTLRAELYGPGDHVERGGWRGDALLQWATALRKTLRQQRRSADRDEVLPPLYPATQANDFSTTS